MANFLVVWWILTSHQIPCPDSVIHANEYNVGSSFLGYSCAVLHMQTTRVVYTKTFEDKDAAEAFVKNAPDVCKGHMQLIDMRDRDEQ